MAILDLLVVGPASRATGGIAQYVTEQRRRLPADIWTRVFDTGTPSGDGPLWFLQAMVVSLFNILRFPFRPRPDIVHVHASHGISFYRSSVYVLFARYVWRRPVVLHVHGSSFDTFVQTESAVPRWYQSLVFDASDSIIVLSTYWKSVMAERVPTEKLSVVPNAVDTSEYDPSTDVGVPTVTFVSNHIERKGIAEFVDAVESIKSNGAPQFDVEIAGFGPLSHHAEAIAADREDVSYLGYVSEPHKRTLLNDGSIYVLPTYAEGLPIALLEGMAGGNAIVSTGVGAIPDLVGSENGVLVEPGDSAALAEALGELIESPATVESMAEANTELVASEYSWSVTKSRLTRLYRSLE